MRRLILTATAVASLAGLGSLVNTRADAMPGVGELGGTTAGQAIARVHLVCERTWNGYNWVRTCYETGPRYYQPRYYGPSVYFGGGHHGGHHWQHHGGHHRRHHGGHYGYH